jgi:hypothetical protein
MHPQRTTPYYPRPRARRPLADRFWEKVRKTPTCWLWVGAHEQHGYGQINLGPPTYQRVLAHHLSWEWANGRPVPDGLKVCHNCPGGDNPACVNPSHLFVDTQAGNMRDCRDKGRLNTMAPTRLAALPHGIQHHAAKLTDADVIALCAEYHTAARTGWPLQHLGSLCE